MSLDTCKLLSKNLTEDIYKTVKENKKAKIFSQSKELRHKIQIIESSTLILIHVL